VKSISAYFLELWRTAAEWTHNDRAAASTKDATLKKSFHDILSSDDEQKVVEDLRKRVKATPNSGLADISNALTCMLCIDEMFARIHPRNLSKTGSTWVKVPDWLQGYKRARLTSGYFAMDARNFLAPKGPLTRACRSDHATSAESFADRFSALSVTSRFFEKDSNRIEVTLSIIPIDSVYGVPLGSKVGHEQIACAAIAEEPGDIKTVSRLCGDNGSILYDIDSHLSPAERMAAVLVRAGPLDIAIAPELVMRQSEAKRLETILATSSGHVCRLIVAGSGNADAGDGKSPWNESQVLNGLGTPLWKQRKLWPALITSELAKKLGVCGGVDADVFYEDNSNCNKLNIADVDGLGRCLVLICQDLKEPCISEVVRQYQPDWIFSPILDRRIQPGGWVHSSVLPLSELSQARFVVSSCISLARREDPSAQPSLGMFHGPQTPADGGPGRCVAFEVSQVPDSPHYVAINWGTHIWSKSNLGTS
jgi:hypothetical protein